MTYLNFLAGPAIGGAIGQGIEQGKQANLLSLATDAARSGDYAALGNALLQLGDVQGGLKALGTPYERQQTELERQRQAEIDRLNRQNIESEIRTREEASKTGDVVAVNGQLVRIPRGGGPAQVV